jgi:hypothetical protein
MSWNSVSVIPWPASTRSNRLLAYRLSIRSAVQTQASGISDRHRSTAPGRRSEGPIRPRECDSRARASPAERPSEHPRRASPAGCPSRALRGSGPRVRFCPSQPSEIPFEAFTHVPTWRYNSIWDAECVLAAGNPPNSRSRISLAFHTLGACPRPPCRPLHVRGTARRSSPQDPPLLRPRADVRAAVRRSSSEQPPPALHVRATVRRALSEHPRRSGPRPLSVDPPPEGRRPPFVAHQHTAFPTLCSQRQLRARRENPPARVPRPASSSSGVAPHRFPASPEAN